MQDITYAVISDPEKAKDAWDELSPHKTIDDEWDFRYTFIKSLHYPLRFIAGYDGDALIGLLPLQRNTREGLLPPYAPEKGEFLEFFGGDDTDDNVLLIKSGYESISNALLSQINEPAVLAPLLKVITYVGTPAIFYENKYVLSLTGYKDHDDYIEAVWSGESRKKLRQRIRKIYNEHRVLVIQNSYADLDILFDMNVKRFGEKSSLFFPYRRQIFIDLIEKYQVEVLSVEINGKVEAVSYGIKYHDVYIGMNAGTNNDIRDLGKLLVLLQIDHAISLGCTEYDGGKGSGVWKEEFGFSKIPQYRLGLNH